jgi:hypothetical protein
MFCQIPGMNPYTPRLYFMVWFIFSNYILLNLVIAFSMQIYQQIADKKQLEYLKRGKVVELYRLFKDNLKIEIPEDLIDHSQADA